MKDIRATSTTPTSYHSGKLALYSISKMRTSVVLIFFQCDHQNGSTSAVVFKHLDDCHTVALKTCMAHKSCKKRWKSRHKGPLNCTDKWTGPSFPCQAEKSLFHFYPVKRWLEMYKSGSGQMPGPHIHYIFHATVCCTCL